jgi:hypothetical protein
MAADPWSHAVDKLEQKLAPYGVAVAYERTVTDSEQDGYEWAMLATDGEVSESLSVSLSASERASLKRAIETEDVEHAVEHRAVAYPPKTRLADLASQDGLTLTADELNKFA